MKELGINNEQCFVSYIMCDLDFEEQNRTLEGRSSAKSEKEGNNDMKTKTRKMKTFGSLDRQNARGEALRAIKMLEKLKNAIASEPSFHEVAAFQLTYQLNSLSELIDQILPVPGTESLAELPS